MARITMALWKRPSTGCSCNYTLNISLFSFTALSFLIRVTSRASKNVQHPMKSYELGHQHVDVAPFIDNTLLLKNGELCSYFISLIHSRDACFVTVWSVHKSPGNNTFHNIFTNGLRLGKL